MTLDYFVIGSRVALRSGPPDPRAASPGRRLDFAVLAPGRVPIGSLAAELRDGRIELDATMSDGDADDRAEALRLAARVCHKLAPVQVFARTQKGGDWQPLPPRPAPAERAPSMDALYRDPFRVVWNFEPLPWELLGPFLAELRARAPAPPVLDLGCGLGSHALRLEEESLEVHGIDVARPAVETCRRWVRHPERYHVASVESLPFDDGFFGGVLDVGCLHCVDARLLGPGIRELSRVLRSGGLLYSRFFKPRDPAWLAAQEFRADAIGLDPERLADLLSRHFEVQLWQDAQLSYVRALRR